MWPQVESREGKSRRRTIPGVIVDEEPGAHKDTNSADPGGDVSDLDRGETLHSLLMSTEWKRLSR
jgi:hypothetical protein